MSFTQVSKPNPGFQICSFIWPIMAITASPAQEGELKPRSAANQRWLILAYVLSGTPRELSFLVTLLPDTLGTVMICWLQWACFLKSGTSLCLSSHGVVIDKVQPGKLSTTHARFQFQFHRDFGCDPTVFRIEGFDLEVAFVCRYIWKDSVTCLFVCTSLILALASFR